MWCLYGHYRWRNHRFLYLSCCLGRGQNIRTLEGLEKNGEITRIQEAFIEEGAIQCGFCTPGFIMSATVLLEQGKELTREEIRKKMSGNLCRCTGYQNIVNAVEKVMHENAEKGI